MDSNSTLQAELLYVINERMELGQVENNWFEFTDVYGNSIY